MGFLNVAYEKTQQHRIHLGLCKDCGDKRGDAGTTIRCRPCADKASERAAKHKAKIRSALSGAANSCNQCGTKVSVVGAKLCNKCRERGRNSYKKHSAMRRELHPQAGLCLKCTTEVFKESKYCKKHWLEGFSIKYAIPPEQLFKKLELQCFRCFFTGKELIPGVNASVDHLHPRSKREDLTGDIDNIVWCDRRINLMKGNFSLEEFVTTCRQVASNAVLACGENVSLLS